MGSADKHKQAVYPLWPVYCQAVDQGFECCIRYGHGRHHLGKRWEGWWHTHHSWVDPPEIVEQDGRLEEEMR